MKFFAAAAHTPTRVARSRRSRAARTMGDEETIQDHLVKLDSEKYHVRSALAGRALASVRTVVFFSSASRLTRACRTVRRTRESRRTRCSASRR